MILRWIGNLCRQLHLCFLAVTPRDSVGNRSPTVRTLAELSSTLVGGRKQVHRGSIREVNLEPIKDYEVNEAEEFWEILSPQRYLFSPQNRPIFRGQADSDWKLIPSILRGQDHPAYSALIFRGSPEQSDQRIFVEIATLLTFAEYCDSAGLRIPSDSSDFRSNFLDPTKVMDTFIFHRKLWPSPEYYEIMAVAQHHGLKTRLLDWSHRSYVAAYFAASEALFNKKAKRFAVWALDTQVTIPRLENLEFIRVPGGNNANVAAQAGLFTLLRQKYARGSAFEGPENLCEYVAALGSKSLAKITLPVSEAPKIIDLCERHGITAAALFPDFYGAARATAIHQACWTRTEWTDGRDIRARTSPVTSDS
jgi:hypothetical protein